MRDCLRMKPLRDAGSRKSAMSPLSGLLSHRNETALKFAQSSAAVKGCRTPARTCGNAATYIGVRAGVGQASREETAACAAVGIEGYGVMAI